ncbi:MAG: hypothetical protein JO112_11270 [Planctomycetes bacterium]|nr:hypothetical protein [Planctomycetota bacterium]
MAEMLLESLVLRGIPVVADVVPVKALRGSHSVRKQPLVLLSNPRHQTPGTAPADYETGARPFAPGEADPEQAAQRAGRPEGSTGGSGGRSPARSAGRAVLLGWSLASEGPSPTSHGPGFTTARFLASRVSALPQRVPTLPVRAIPPGQLMRLPRGKQLGRGGKPASLYAGCWGEALAFATGKGR